MQQRAWLSNAGNSTLPDHHEIMNWDHDDDMDNLHNLVVSDDEVRRIVGGGSNQTAGSVTAAQQLARHSHLLQSSSRGDNSDVQYLGMQERRSMSDVEIYGPRFCTLFNEYERTRPDRIDLSRHLMSLITENLIPFTRWARESEDRTYFIKHTLLENDYLRSEVRNGIIMVLLYTFAAVKASKIDSITDSRAKSSRKPACDMFKTLLDPERGLGIANKFSLRIYNDPFLYLSFLKYSLSGLIDAGVIPDNERQNQPAKRNKLQEENAEEFAAFSQIQYILVNFLEKGDNMSARKMMQVIVGCWQQKAKFLRNRRFVSALAALSTEHHDRGTHLSYHLPVQPFLAMQPVVAERMIGNSSDTFGVNNLEFLRTGSTSLATIPDASTSNESSTDDTGEYMDGRGRRLPAVHNSSVDLPRQRRRLGENAVRSCAATLPADVAMSTVAPRRPVPALRMQRVDCCEWTVLASVVYDIESLTNLLQMSDLDAGDASMYLVDDRKLLDNLVVENRHAHTAMTMTSSMAGLQPVSLMSELRSRDALVAVWSPSEAIQFRRFLADWQSRCVAAAAVIPPSQGHSSFPSSSAPSPSMVDLWHELNPLHYSHGAVLNLSGAVSSATEATTSSRAAAVGARDTLAPIGAIVYERVSQVGVVIRANPDLGLRDDVWGLMFPRELQKNATHLLLPGDPSSPDVSFGEYLGRLFPQVDMLVKAVALSRESPPSVILIKYCTHKHNNKTSSSTTSPLPNSSDSKDVHATCPVAPSTASYRTIGSLTAPATAILARLPDGYMFHDFIFERQAVLSV